MFDCNVTVDRLMLLMHQRACWYYDMVSAFGTVLREPLLIVSPIEPRSTGNGLAMRVGNICRVASELFNLKVAVLPFAGTPPPTGRIDRLAVTVVRAQRSHVQRPEIAPQALASDIVSAVRPVGGSRVLALRSYIGPVALAVAEQIDALWVGIDLDDDDEGFALRGGDLEGAARFHRLVSSTVARFSAICASSTIDADTMARRHGVSISTVVNGVDVPSTRPLRSSTGTRILFVGNLTYPPNVQAALTLAHEIFPAVRQEQSLDGTELLLVGPSDHRGPIPVLGSREGVTVAGFVPDLEPIYRASSVVVAPIFHASGTRIKILEAFARGVPVVTTPAGASGLPVRHERHLLIAETASSLAHEVVRLLSDQPLAESLASEAFNLVHDRFSLRAQREQIAALLR